MTKLLFALHLFVLSTPSYAETLSKELLQGQWLVVQVGDLKTKDLGIGEDSWQFKNNELTVISNGKALSPDTYQVRNNEIVIRSFSIKVSEFSTTRMVTDSSGIVQILNKI